MLHKPGRPVPRTFLFSDLRSYTEYVERAGDAAASRLLRTYRELVRHAIAKEEGVEVKTEGDSFYVVFDSSVSAVRCALAIQRAAARQRREPLAIGIGIHAGEATPFDEQYVGSAVNIAARLASVAAPGEILISETVRGLIRTALRLPFEDRGVLTLKGIKEPIRVYAIRATQEAEPARTAAPPTTAMEAVFRGDLEGAARIASAVLPQASFEDRCNALAVLTILAAARGDVEAALARTEHLLPVALRASERSWVRVAYALRAWLYFLARQPGEAMAELDRAFDRPGSSVEACMALLLAVTVGGSSAHAERLRHVAKSCPDRTVEGACAAAGDVLGGQMDTVAARNQLAGVGGPLFGALVEFQLCARIHRQIPSELQAALARAHADRLTELILQALQ